MKGRLVIGQGRNERNMWVHSQGYSHFLFPWVSLIVASFIGPAPAQHQEYPNPRSRMSCSRSGPSPTGPEGHTRDGGPGGAVSRRQCLGDGINLAIGGWGGGGERV